MTKSGETLAQGVAPDWGGTQPLDGTWSRGRYFIAEGRQLAEGTAP